MPTVQQLQRRPKKNAWKDIVEVLQVKCPDSKVRTVEEVKKKWNNLKTVASKDIARHRKSLAGAGIVII